jgi:hypothetical protein
MEREQPPDIVIERVFKRFEEADRNQTKWTTLDTNMEYLAWLDDDQVVREAELVLDDHKKGDPRCKIDHKKSECFVPSIIKAIGYLIVEYKIGGKLDKKDRYILEYYISLSQIGEIFT